MLKARVDELAEALLLTDVGAIAADRDHIVFTVRISREMLRNNHSLLGMVSDFAGGADLPKRQTAPPAPEVPITAPKSRGRSRIRALMAEAFARLAAIVTALAVLLDPAAEVKAGAN